MRKEYKIPFPKILQMQKLCAEILGKGFQPPATVEIPDGEIGMDAALSILRKFKISYPRYFIRKSHTIDSSCKEELKLLIQNNAEQISDVIENYMQSSEGKTHRREHENNKYREQRRVEKQNLKPSKAEHAIAVVKLFLEFGVTKNQFTKAVGISDFVFDGYVELAIANMPELEQTLDKIMAENSAKWYTVMTKNVSKTVESIRSGMTDLDGNTRPYTILDHEISCMNSVDELATFANRNSDKNTAYVLKKFKDSNKYGFMPLKKQDVLRVATTIGGYRVTGADIEAVFDFLDNSRLTHNRGNYNAALSYYISNKGFPNVENYITQKERKDNAYSSLRKKFEELGAQSKSNSEPIEIMP